GNQQQAVEAAHIMKALLTADENIISHLLKKLDVNLNHLSSEIDKLVASYPKVSGSQVYLSNSSTSVLQKASSYLKEFNDEFVSIEHVLLGLLSSGDAVARLLKEQGVTEKYLKKAIQE